ncbi:hypothetical protein QFZ24_004737 [Streptomyces phaeochromogenes]|jgi:hypothetical protein|uniref:hypothetical protein n=1 Tax=Streptomyces TaxID=1883 RepID=UPI0021B147AF|nr:MULTISPECIES: hypothetical protein [Streptomyces]MDQ0950814.1 hypothetical protein [Streptomyces phaeochromogenes]
MSAFAVKGTAEDTGVPSGGPVKGLPWAVLRLHRAALVVWGAFMLAALGALVWEAGINADSVRDRIAACGHDSSLCRFRAAVDYGGTTGWASTLVYYSFFAVAAFAAGALIGRELENGTAQLAWTQSVSPTRWLAVTLAVPAVLLVAGGTVFVFVFRWAWAANRDLMGDDWTFNDVFAARGPALVAYGLCGLGVGALAGVVLRRSLPALGIACGVMYLINHNLEKYREDLWPPVTPAPTKGVEMSRDVWQIGDGTGRFHPRSHYWPMHLVETGIVLGVAVLATGAAFWVLRRRTG